MVFKVGDVVQLKSGGARMTVFKLFKSPEGREVGPCTWFDKKPREHRAAFVIDALEEAAARTTKHEQPKLAGGSIDDLPITVSLRRKVTSMIGMTEVIPVSCRGKMAEPLGS